MPLEERRSRHKVLFHSIAENDIKSWGELFLATLTKESDLPLWHEQLGIQATLPTPI
jgi:trehalose-6-phosphate synthase